MRILDLDLDFFVDGIARSYRGSQRLDEAEYAPWPASDVQQFLERNCGLNRSRPLPGIVITNHHEAFHYWRRLIARGQLAVPFEVVHVDAHADLGIGESGWAYIAGDLLHRPVGERYFPHEGFTGLNLSNYLAFAAACRWLSRVTYVRHPEQTNDLPAIHFKGFDTSSGFLQLKAFHQEDLNSDLRLIHPLVYEPEIPFALKTGTGFVSDRPFDIIVLSQSPGFTPASSDGLIPVISGYISQQERNEQLVVQPHCKKRRGSFGSFSR